MGTITGQGRHTRKCALETCNNTFEVYLSTDKKYCSIPCKRKNLSLSVGRNNVTKAIMKQKKEIEDRIKISSEHRQTVFDGCNVEGEII